MHLRYAAIIVLIIWALMIPPMAGGKMDTSAPLAQWTEFGAFQDQRTCEAAQGEMREDPMTSYQLGKSRCVPAPLSSGGVPSPGSQRP